MRLPLVALLLSLAVMPAAMPVLADDKPAEPPADAPAATEQAPQPLHPLLESCVSSPTPDAATIACSSAIDSRQLQGDALAMALYARGMAQARRGQMQAGILDFTAAIDLAPDATDALYARGSAQAQIQRHDLAVADYDRVLKIEPRDLDSLYRRAWSLTMLGRDKEAVADLTAVIQQVPDDIDAIMDRGGLLIRLGDFKAAIADFDRVLKSEKDAAAAHYNRGRAHALLGDAAAAQRDFAAARAARAENPYAALREYLAASQAGKPEQKLLEDAIQHFPIDQWPLPVLACLAGQISESDLLAAAGTVNKVTAQRLAQEAHFYLGEAAWAKKDAKAARAHFEAAAKGDRTVPEVIDAGWRLAQLKP
ncbi:tetratricopeptide repeat protein [Dongia mobilis]|uniref:Tetratricopeptide repeat protein n=1 Tax=Dongia mobilis TaxID=578943 RepID=A0A4R6WTG0_9PROT|nr:tetratricopeptide repeat protein [Dongia mobilis]TDQ82180.1 tetratricopeptide repeat protein [Dongia mobilis]